ncbi:MAG: hypothetical protein KAG94_04825 [Clostridiales bacterium]|nr:hypothetical protein [Clostridiales bacterium]
MLEKMCKQAKQGKNIFITNVRREFLSLTNKQQIIIALESLKLGEKKYFDIAVPSVFKKGEQSIFIQSYINAEIYNILSSLGGTSLTIYTDLTNKALIEILEKVRSEFSLDLEKSERQFYGNCINVIDRMIKAIHGDKKKFGYIIKDISEKPIINKDYDSQSKRSDMLKRVTKNLENKAICGIDIGGTDIKMALSDGDDICCFKEYDWNPKSFIIADQLINPVVYLTKLVRAYYSMIYATSIKPDQRKKLDDRLKLAMDKHAKIELIVEVVDEIENVLSDEIILLDAIGISFPDVVVKDKIVGGETTKTIGIKRNREVDFEQEFAKITSLDLTLLNLCKKGGVVKSMNDGPAAAYTAAVEMFATNPNSVVDGVFAHSLGTELGTGWVDGASNVPEMPLECYNFIIDLGNFIEKAYDAEDVRSTNNVNTLLTGTLQKYTSQSGVFRLALQYFEKQRPLLYREILEKGFVVEKEVNGVKMMVVPTTPKDMRKGFLEHVMSLPLRENDELVNEIFRQIGVYLAITWYETEYILSPECKERTLFGRVVKNKRCFDLIKEGAKSIKGDIVFTLADGKMANTKLMKRLEADENYTVAQFAQAVGVIYYGNQGLIEKQK